MADTTSRDKYITFPISALTTGLNPDDVTSAMAKARGRMLIWVSVFRLVEKIQGGLYEDPTTVTQMAERAWSADPEAAAEFFEVDDDLPDDENVDCLDEDAQALLAACAVHGLDVSDLNNASGEKAADMLEKMTTWLDAVTKDTGRRVARVSMDIVAMLERGELTWRQFSVLAAVYACLNESSREAARLYYDQIAAMASGFGSRNIAKAAGRPAQEFLTYKQVRSTVDEVWQREFFSKVPGGRGIWCSIRLSQAALVNYVSRVEVETERGAARKRAGDVRAAVRRKKAEIRGESTGTATTVQRPFNDRSADPLSGQHDGQLLKKVDNTREPDRAQSRARSRAPSWAATEETSSEETSSEETTSSARFFADAEKAAPAATTKKAGVPVAADDPTATPKPIREAAPDESAELVADPPIVATTSPADPVAAVSSTRTRPAVRNAERYATPPQLTAEQRASLEGIRAAMESRRCDVRLEHGTPGQQDTTDADHD